MTTKEIVEYIRTVTARGAMKIPVGNQHTKGSPTRHPATSIFDTYLYLVFNGETGGNSLRQQEISTHWKEKRSLLRKNQ